MQKIEGVIEELLKINMIAGAALSTALGATPFAGALSIETAIARILDSALSAHLAQTGTPFDLSQLQPIAPIQ